MTYEKIIEDIKKFVEKLEKERKSFHVGDIDAEIRGEYKGINICLEIIRNNQDNEKPMAQVFLSTRTKDFRKSSITIFETRYADALIPSHLKDEKDLVQVRLFKNEHEAKAWTRGEM